MSRAPAAMTFRSPQRSPAIQPARVVLACAPQPTCPFAISLQLAIAFARAAPAVVAMATPHDPPGSAGPGSARPRWGRVCNARDPSRARGTQQAGRTPRRRRKVYPSLPPGRELRGKRDRVRSPGIMTVRPAVSRPAPGAHGRSSSSARKCCMQCGRGRRLEAVLVVRRGHCARYIER